ncbi:splicing factor U2af large subunit A-like [Malus domestica]|uniref:splicing factor U2af large subunit A-like n=1 Tax=Malus domestica TaxID=3750 RepID=UPI003975A32C
MLGVVQNSLPFGALHMALPLMPAQAMIQQATRHARRVYVVSELAGDEGVMKRLYEGVMQELHTLKEREPKVVIKFAASNLGC